MAVTRTKSKKVSAFWRKILMGLPGYDPFAQAGEAWFDPDRAAAAIQRFETCIRHVEGKSAGKPFLLEPWEKALVANLFGWVEENAAGAVVRRFREVFVYVPRKNGKALALDTPIPIPSGWTTMGEINAGDVVFDETGHSCRVLMATEVQHGRKCYRVSFSDGTSIIADADHLWETDARTDRDRLKGRGGKAAGPKPSIKTTEEIKESLNVIRPATTKKGVVERNHRIAVCGPISIEEDACLKVDPYALGVWLGDGNSASAQMTCHIDEQIPRLLAEVGVSATLTRKDPRSNAGTYSLQKKRDGRCRRGHARDSGRCQECDRNVNYARRHGLPLPPVTLVTMQEELRSIGVLGNKHIPPAYLRGSHRQRLALLQGLMDTDGYVSKAGQCEFTTTKVEIRDGIIELIRSLGFKVTCSQSTATIYGRPCGRKYRIQFWARSDEPIFRLPRKIERLKARPAGKTRNHTKQIIAVDPVPSVPVRCIMVDSPSGLYLAGNGFTPTHNTALAAALVLVLFFFDGEAGGQFISAAADRDQAALIFRQAKGMISRAPALEKRCKVLDSFKSIFLLADPASTYKAVSAEAYTKHGLNVHVAVIDELHAQPNRELVDTLISSMGFRTQPLTIYTTTADYMRESICNEVYDYACKVRDNSENPALGVNSSRMLPVIYEAGKDDDWTDPEIWRTCNPNLGVTIELDFLRAECEKAQAVPAYENTFRRLYLNQRTQQDQRAIPMEQWIACGHGSDPKEWRMRMRESMAGQPCVAGLDLSSRNDLVALVFLFTDIRPKVVLPFFWATQSAIERRRRDRVPYDEWVNQGFITATDGDEVDYAWLRRDIVELVGTYPLKQGYDVSDKYTGAVCLAVDRLFQGVGVCQDLKKIDGIETIEFGQGFYSMAMPTKRLLEMIGAREIDHGNNPVLSWMAGNASTESDPAGNLKFNKRKSGDKIDGIIGLTMAVGLGEGASISEEPGIFS